MALARILIGNPILSFFLASEHSEVDVADEFEYCEVHADQLEVCRP
jgi:hypothetical protein